MDLHGRSLLKATGLNAEEFLFLVDLARRLRADKRRGVTGRRLGERFDGEKLEAYPPGSVIVLPGGTPHFHWARSGEYVTQVTAIGPLGLEDLDPEDYPRHDQATRPRDAERAAGELLLAPRPPGSRHEPKLRGWDAVTISA